MTYFISFIIKLNFEMLHIIIHYFIHTVQLENHIINILFVLFFTRNYLICFIMHYYSFIRYPDIYY